ncbi:hypothetical protein ACOME3_000367 [Neoechinorhynchus agilis]
MSLLQSEQKDILSSPVDVWDSTALRNRLDDCIREIVRRRSKTTLRHSIMDTRLFLSFICVCFSGSGLLYDKLHPYPESKIALLVCVPSYFAVMAVLTAFMFFVERGCFVQLRCESPFHHELTFRSRIKKYDHIYELDVLLDRLGNQRQWWPQKDNVGKMRRSVANYFDQKGNVFIEEIEKDVDRLMQEVQTLISKRRN